MKTSNKILFIDIETGLLIVMANQNKSGTKKIFHLMDKYKNILLSHENPIAVYQYTLEKLEELDNVEMEVRK